MVCIQIISGVSWSFHIYIGLLGQPQWQETHGNTAFSARSWKQKHKQITPEIGSFLSTLHPPLFQEELTQSFTCAWSSWLPQKMDGYGWEILRRRSTKSCRWRETVIRPMPPSSHLESVPSFFPKTMNLFDIDMVLPPPAGPSQNSRPYQRNSSQSVSFRCSRAIILSHFKYVQLIQIPKSQPPVSNSSSLHHGLHVLETRPSVIIPHGFKRISRCSPPAAAQVSVPPPVPVSAARPPQDSGKSPTPNVAGGGPQPGEISVVWL